LPDGHDLKELWVRCGLSGSASVPLVDANGDGTIRVNNSSEIGQVEFSHDDPPDKEYTMRGTTTSSTRNRRDVWTIPTAPYKGAHFATFPPALVEPCILAGSSPKACGVCGAPWERVTEHERRTVTGNLCPKHTQSKVSGLAQPGWRKSEVPNAQSVTLGWRPTCDHDAAPVPALVLDPFCGSGTVGLVAQSFGRRFVGLDLSRPYLGLAVKRINSVPMGMAL
jgi:hypothetical protein